MLRRLSTWAVTALAAQRIAEVALSRRHERTMRAAGAVEAGRAHYPWIVAMHAAWLLSTLVEARPPHGRRSGAAFAGFLGAQALRYWCIVTLGRRWTTSIIVPPGGERVTSGPYRWLDHPNYAAVAVEIAAFPMIFRARRTAVAFSLADAVLLAVRIRAENAALARAGAVGEPNY